MILNVQDILAIVNMIINNSGYDSLADLNSDGIINVIDIVDGF